jgi:DNA-binding NtrC family response regulator
MGKATVLVVDNENDVLKIIKNALGTISYDIIFSKNGKEALTRLKSSPIDIVLADQSIFDMACLEFLKIVKKEYPDVVTIMLADRMDLDTTLRAINEAGVYRFVQKPWNSFELRINISRGLEFKNMIMEKRRLLEQIKKNDVILQKLEKKFPYIDRIIHQEVGSDF